MKSKKETTTKAKSSGSKLDTTAKTYIDRFEADFDALSVERSSWEDKEKSIIGMPVDSYTSNKSGSKINDMSMHTAIIKRTNATIGQLPTGKVQAITKADAGKNIAMDLILRKYVIPNAKTQHDMFTKAWMWEFYSLFFGTYDVLVDYVVTDKYVGPDWYLIPKRRGIPQKNRISIDDCDRYSVISNVSRKWLLSRDTKTWKNIDKLLEQTKGPKEDSELQSYNESKNNNSTIGTGKDEVDDIEIITTYEGDRWFTFSRDTKLTLRDIDNKGIQGELPIVSKHCFPLIDRYHGLGEYERLNPLQNSINSLIALYLQGIKMSLHPPLKLYLPDLVASTIADEPGAKWVLKNMNVNAITEHTRSPQGINSFQATYSFLKGALLNAAGTTDTTSGEDFAAGMGKSPQALKMQAAFDQARSNFDQKMMDESMGKVFDKMVNLIATKQEKPIKMNLFKKELESIQKYNPDLTEMFESGNYGEVTIKPEFLKDKDKTVKYKFFIDPSSTVKKDQAIENQTLDTILATVAKFPGAMEQAMAKGFVIMGNKKIDIAQTIKKFVSTSGIQDPEEIVSELQPEELQQIQAEEAMKASQAQPGQMIPGQQPTGPGIEQIMGGQEGGLPPSPGMPSVGAPNMGAPQGMPQGQVIQQPQESTNFEQPPFNGMAEGLSMESQQILNELSGRQ
jgi:hypothetical protein